MFLSSESHGGISFAFVSLMLDHQLNQSFVACHSSFLQTPFCCGCLCAFSVVDQQSVPKIVVDADSWSEKYMKAERQTGHVNNLKP